MARKPVLWMLVGVPCSGKSTWVNHQTEKNDDILIASTDDILEGIAQASGKTYNEVFKDNIKSAEKRMYMNIALATDLNQDIIWDQTNLTRKSRAKKLIMIPDHYEKIAVVFSTPEENELQRRLASRLGKTIPSHVIDGMIEMMEFPQMDEGFDTIMDYAEEHLYV